MADVFALDAFMQKANRRERVKSDDGREDQVLWAMLNHPAALEVGLAILRKEDFTTDPRRVVFRALKHLHTTGAMDANYFGVLELLQAHGVETRVDLSWYQDLTRYETIRPRELRAACQAIKDRRKRIDAVQALEKTSEALLDPWSDPDELARQVQGHLATLRRDSGLVRLSYKGQAAKVAQVAKERLGGDRFTTGLPRLDFHLGGGFGRRNLLTIAAGSGAGKSTIAGRICRLNAEQGKRVLIITGELEPAVYHFRILADMTGIEVWRIEAHLLGESDLLPEEADRINWAHNRLDEIDLEILGVCTDPDEVEALLVESSAEQPLDLVCLDLPEKMAPQTNEAQTKMWDAAREWAGRFNVAILALAQWRTGFDARQGTETPRVHWINFGKSVHKASTQIVQIRLPNRGEQKDGEVPPPPQSSSEPEWAQLIISKTSFQGKGHGERARPISCDFLGAFGQFQEREERR